MEEKLNQIFVGKKYDKFQKKVFSIPAFFFGAVYFAYRKMIIEALVSLIILTLLYTLVMTYLTNIALIIITVLCINISVGLYFPIFYRSFCAKSVNKIIEKNSNASEEQLISIALKKGGTSTILVIVFLILNTVLSLKFNSMLNKPELPGEPVKKQSVSQTIEQEDEEEIVGETNLLVNQEVIGHSSSMGEYEIFLKDIETAEETTVKCDEETLNVFKFLYDYDDYIKVNVEITVDGENIVMTSYTILNLLTEEEIEGITDEDSLRISLGLKASGEYEEILILKEDLNNAFGQPGAPSFGFKDDVTYMGYTYLFEDENGETFELEYVVYDSDIDNSGEFAVGNKYNIKYIVEPGTFGYEMKIESFEKLD